MTKSAHPYQTTERLLYGLIDVEIWARNFLDQLNQTRSHLESEKPGEDFRYTTPPGPEATPEMARLRTERRADIPQKYRHLVEDLDRHHEFQNKWRRTLEDAKVLANMASAELDAKKDPPLSRTSTGIKRSLQRMGASYPNQFSRDLHQICEDWWVPLMRKQRDEIGVWIDELRLLVVPDPRVTLPEHGEAPSKKRKSDKPKPASWTIQDLDEDDLCLLQTFMEAGAFSYVTCKTLNNALKLAFAKITREGQDRGRDLKKAGFLDAQDGKKGGYWLTAKGQECLRSAGRWRDPQTIRNAP